MNQRRSLQVMAIAFFQAIVALPSLSAAPAQEALVTACSRGDLDAAQRLLDAGAKINDPDDEERTPLLAALFSRNEAVVAWALKNGADPNLTANCPERQCRGHSGLVGAVRSAEPRLVRLVLDAKADVTAGDNVAARQANVRGSAEILRMIRAAGGSETGATGGVVQTQPAGNGAPRLLSGLSALLPAGPEKTRKAGAKMRVAILAEDALRAASDLLATSLASGPFDLIERAELNRILDEHKLTAQLGADGTRATELGALLGADALVLLRKVQLGETASAEMRFVRVSPGIVLDSAYRAWPLPDASAWAADAAARLANLDPKIRDDRAIAIATAPFRPLTDSPGATSLARECLLLLNDQLAHQSGVVLLERSAVDALSREQAIGKEGSFWAGSYLLDGTVEPATREAGPTAITLRLAPIGPGDVKTFTVRGPRAELPGLIRDLVTRAAAELKLSATPPSDLQAEAQRHFDESRNLVAVGLLVAAHRAAQTAAAFGLDTEEFIEWRLDTALRLIEWQAKRLGDNLNFYPLRLSGWSEAWIEGEINGAEWLRPVEWCDLGVEAVRLWQRLLGSALRGDDARRAEMLLSQKPFQKNLRYPLNRALSVFNSLDLAATTLDHSAMHLRISTAVREALEESLRLADAKHVHASNACKIAVTIANRASVIYRDRASLDAGFEPLLTRNFATENTATRVAIRQALFSLNTSQTSHGPPTVRTLRDAATRGSAVEDEIMRALYECLLPKDKAQQPALADKLFDLLWERRQMFVDASTTIRFFEQICSLVARFVRNAPKFRFREVQTSGNQEIEYSPEMHDLRRKLFLLVAKNATRPGPALWLLDKNYHPAGEDAAEIAALYQQVQNDYHLDEMEPPSASEAQSLAARRLRPPMRGTPTYAKYPPLKIDRHWTAEPTPHGQVEDLRIEGPAYDSEADALWLFGEFVDQKFVYGYAFEVSLPTLKTKAWPLPPVERTLSRGTTQQFGLIEVFPTSEFLYLAKAEHFLAIGNRKTGEWKLNPEVKPADGFVRAGGDLFFLTRSGGARGLASLSLRDHAVTIHASNRRTPPQTPLDRTDLIAVSLKAGETGLVEITTEPFDATEDKVRGNSGEKPRSVVTFDPSQRRWTEPKLAEKPPAVPRTFTPLVAAGIPTVYRKQSDTNVWTMQMPRPDMPKARLPLEFVAPKDRTLRFPDSAAIGRSWSWTPHGYIIIESPAFEPSLVYFLPQSELDAYLDAHQPDEDETGGAPPMPTKPAPPQ